MSKPTAIEWTDRSSNPVRYRDQAGRDVWACEKVSAGCRGCYAEALALRFDKGKAFNAGNMAGLTPYLSSDEVKALLSPKKTPAGSKVFVGDMTDVFGHWVPDAILDGLFVTFAVRPDVTFQVLTKRPERMAEYVRGADGRHIRFDVPGVVLNREPFDWPLPNVWLGTSVENQQAADERIPHLLTTPAAVRFLSCEPLLGPVTLPFDRVWCRHHHRYEPLCMDESLPCFRWQASVYDMLPWVIAGGESGPDARPMHPMWARSVRDQCQEAGIAFHFKQWGEWADYRHARDELKLPFPPEMSKWATLREGGGVESGVLDARHQPMLKVGKKAAGRTLDGRTWDEFPVSPAPCENTTPTE